MKTLFRALAGGACGLLIAGTAWLAVELDNAELQAGKSPHSGFSPDCPKAFDGLPKPSRPEAVLPKK
ncbi:hypothetical protein [Akkermansia sp.]|uniref:hypothetical protein n=1 Tax=Akkermansia sp. TaxID=1872421 RepID=UPI0025BCD201|nr:hypothetical protein [Akkermansia sp.]